jgi:DNA helicase-2/ATP-dependent DNA helicase PcrA
MPALTEAQEDAIRSGARRLQIVACAGSGKTEVLARRAVRLLQEGADPASLIAFTFTDKAAAELKARIEARAAEADPRFRDLPPVGRGMFVGTTHGWALQALRDLGGDYETMDGLTAEQEWVLLFRMARRLGIVKLYSESEGRGAERVATAPAIQAFLRSAEVAHDERLDRAVLKERAPQFAEALERYEWLLRKMRLLPFRLMIGWAIDELAPGGRLRERLKGRVSHVLADEFQDFNPGQDRLLGYLGELGASITVVGDDDQAIYQWRGGDVKLFVDFASRHKDTTHVRLGQNHRCRPEIVRFARAVVDALPAGERLPKILESSRALAERGAVEAFLARNPEAEGERIADRIEALVRGGHELGEIAVLYRSVRTSARPLVQQLHARRIPAVVVGKASLLVRPEMALVARIFVYWAGGTWYPNPEFQPEAVTRESLLGEIRSVTGLGQRAADEAFAHLERLGNRVHREGAGDSIVLLHQILATLRLPGSGDLARSRELGLGQMSTLLEEFDHAARRAAPRELYEQVAGAAADEAQEDRTLTTDQAQPAAGVLGATRGEIYLVRMKAFLEEFAGRAAEETPGNAPEAEKAVQVMTIHQAKGLEFPVVFVPSLVEGRFPTRLMGRPQQWYVPPDLFDRQRYEGREEDEARLLYVALTRARELLVVSWFEQHKTRRAQPSRFVRRQMRTALEEALPSGRAAPAVVKIAAPESLLDTDFSSLTTYMECAYRYYLRQVCGFKPPLAPELGFGKLVHHLVAELARRATAGGTPTEADVDAILAGSFYLPFAGAIPATKLRESARRRVRRYVRRHGDELRRTVQPEVSFEVPLANARVRGRIDLMLRADGGGARQVELIDFKTSENRPPSEIHQNQLRLYAAAAERLGLEPVRLSIHDLDSEKRDRIDVPHDDAASERFTQRLQSWVAGIRAGTFTPAEDQGACRGCDFARFCRHAPAQASAA